MHNETVPDPELDGPDVTEPATELDTPSAATTWRKSGRRKPTAKAKPTHYKTICISMYTTDLKKLDAKVAELKRRGKTKMSKSELIRLALEKLNLDEVG